MSCNTLTTMLNTYDYFFPKTYCSPWRSFLPQTGEHELPNWGDYWNPQLLLENALGDVKESVWYVVSYDKEGQATVYERRRVRGTFFESMELKEYPFDAQVIYSRTIFYQF